MQVFSKMLNNDYITKNDETNNDISKTEEKLISYNDYFKDKNSITKYKLDKLKKIAKLHKLISLDLSNRIIIFSLDF
jgi:hypothetical protein